MSAESRQTRLDGWVIPEPAPVPYRTDREGYEIYRHQFRDDNGDKRERTVRVHRLSAVAWFGFDALAGDMVVHHRSNVPWDNREENLEVMDRAAHSKLHNTTEGEQ